MYYLVYGLLYLISLLPFWLLYRISDLAAFILFRLVKYRRSVVLSNLQIAFPEKSQAERESICKQFYYRFADNFIELIKLISLSKKRIKKRFISDMDVLKKLHNEGLNVDMVLGHYFNWEWGNLAYVIDNPYTQLVVYAHISSSTTERLMKKIRSRFGTKLIDSAKFKEQYKPYAHQQKSFVLVADQSPRFIKSAFWLNYFKQKTAFTKGPETSARLNNSAVIYCHIRRIKRGYYASELKIFTKEARNTARGEITKHSAAFFEAVIREDPPNYLWSHRRWKHPFKEERDSKNIIE